MPMTKDEFLALRGQHPKQVTLPGYGDVYIRKLDGRDVEYLQGGKDGGADSKKICTQVTIRGVCDENGERMFRDADFAEVHQMQFELLKEITDKVYEHSGMTEDAEDIAGNSE